MRKTKLVVGLDDQLRKELLEAFHTSADMGHSGVEATMKRLNDVVYWKGLKKMLGVLFEVVQSANSSNMTTPLILGCYNLCLFPTEFGRRCQ